VWEALQETETVVCLHLGSGSWVLTTAGDRSSVTDVTIPALFPASAMVTAMEWVFSGVPARYPNMKIALSEGGIGWVPMAIDRLDYIVSHTGALMRDSWIGDESPAEVLLNHFWFCMIDNPSNLDARKMIGTDHIMIETDYPHTDSTWPDTQELCRTRFAGFEREETLDITYRNAEKLFRHPVPESWLQTTSFWREGQAGK
jgi:predicted TIM-barrel fold metal-dependent hydrolase